jgi:hypothetical protein
MKTTLEKESGASALLFVRRKSRFDGISADCYESGLGHEPRL